MSNRTFCSRNRNRCRSATKTLKLTTTSTFQGGRFYTDTDGLKLTCRPAVDSCDPATLFAGTFDRIQKQVFNTTCAVSGCHDSQTQANGMLLEVGAAYTQIVGATPTNVAAQGLGWDRVTSGDPTTSLLFHKITGAVTVALGTRMPLGRPPLAATLLEIIRLWIAAGAPETGWVDFDPTNNMVAGDEHIAFAYGRDYDDISPISGILLGGNEHTVTVAVDVTPLD